MRKSVLRVFDQVRHKPGCAATHKMVRGLKFWIKKEGQYYFCIFEIIIFCFVVAICDLVHAMEAMYGLP